MITEAHGNLLESRLDAVVNTVNTVGVMGKGIALQFKRAYPQMFKVYETAARRGEIEIGRMHVWPTEQLDGPRFVINFPTKRHWRSSSRLADVAAGLDDLVEVINDQHIRSIAIPPLGCGQGGLKWSDVEPLIHEKLKMLTGVDIQLYPPEGAPPAADMRTTGAAPTMTIGRAALIELVRRYSTVAVEGATPIAVQKLMYFLQIAGEKLSLRYESNYYGPYADNLRIVLREIEGHYLEGFGDGSQRVELGEPFRLLDGAEQMAREVLHEQSETLARIERVLELTSGFESTTSLELLATVHWVAEHPNAASRNDDAIVESVRHWSNRKARLFTPGQVQKALGVLRDKGWVSPSA